MPFIALFLLALALSADAFAVSAASGVRIQQVRFAQAFRMAACFGFFQAIMPMIGWLLGYTVRDYIEQFDHWIAFGLLAFIGLHMFWEARESGDCCSESSTEDDKDPTKGKVLMILGIATSIDALAVGLSISVLKDPIVVPALIIGLITFCISFFGVYLGALSSKNSFVSKYASIIGGVMLIGIGVKILFEHGVFS